MTNTETPKHYNTLPMLDFLSDKNRARVRDPFIYKIDPEDYLSLTRAAIDKPGVFREAKRLRETLTRTPNDAEAYQSAFPSIREYLPLLRRWQETEWQEENFRARALQFLRELQDYHYFFKETGAGLKFNPLSARPTGRELRLRMVELLETYTAQIRPRALYVLCDAAIDDGGILLADSGIRFNSRKLAEFFTSPTGYSGTMHAQKIPSRSRARKPIKPLPRVAFIYLVTIGAGIDDAVHALMREGEMLDAYLLNGIGGGAAEMAAYDLNLYLNDHLTGEEPALTWRRFSPGYGDWNVRDQQKIFAILEPEQRIGVRLSEGDIMIPEKSTSGIMVVGSRQ